MVFQRIPAKVAIEVPPDGMHVIRSVLGVVVLDHKGWSLNSIVVALAGFRSAHPSEPNFAPVLDAA